MSQEKESGGKSFSRLGVYILPKALEGVKDLKSADDINERYAIMFGKSLLRGRSIMPRVNSYKKDYGVIHFTINAYSRFNGDPLYVMCMVAEIYQYLLQDLFEVRSFYAELHAAFPAEIQGYEDIEGQHLDVEGLQVMDDGSVVYSFSTYGELKPLKS